MTRIDVPRLQQLARRIRADVEDADNPAWYKNGIMTSIVEIVEDTMKAPAMQVTFERGTEEADRQFPGSPSQRLAFNAGVQWCLEQMNAPLRK